jgi:hypothetical protein
MQDLAREYDAAGQPGLERYRVEWAAFKGRRKGEEDNLAALRQQHLAKARANAGGGGGGAGDAAREAREYEAQKQKQKQERDRLAREKERERLAWE